MSRVKAMKKPCFAEKYGFFIGYILLRKVILPYGSYICLRQVILLTLFAVVDILSTATHQR